jgi:hypothetical protein
MTKHMIKALVIIALMAAPALGAEVSRIDNYVDILKSDIKAQKEALTMVTVLVRMYRMS